MAAPQKIKSNIVKIINYKDNVSLFKLDLEKKCHFRPGQFIHLAIDKFDPSFNWPESRAFSIANSPLRSNIIDILVSPKGSFTKRMITELRENDEVWIKLPFGMFNFNQAVDSDCVLIAGGTGISPFISFLEYAVDTFSTFKSLRLFYGVRDKELIIFEDLFQECSKKIKGFEYSVFIENYDAAADKNIFSGILPVEQIVNKTRNHEKSVYYLSGPKAMITAFEKELKQKNIPERNIYFDKWE
jgi:NAD(P)H-flavin reductase